MTIRWLWPYGLLLLAAATTTGANAEPLSSKPDKDGLVWSLAAINDPDEPSPRAAQLVFGIPETDATKFVATCTVNDATRSSVEFAARPGARRDGTPVKIKITGSDRAMEFEAKILNPASGEGLTGYKANIKNDSRLFQAMSSLRALTYRADGDTHVYRLGLIGAGPIVRAYLAHCAELSAANDVDPIQLASCESLAGRTSNAGGDKLVLTVTNATDATRGLLWINAKGMPTDFATLEPGGALQIATRTSHVWMVTDGPGNCLERFVPKSGQTDFRMTVPNRDFGPE